MAGHGHHRRMAGRIGSDHAELISTVAAHGRRPGGERRCGHGGHHTRWSVGPRRRESRGGPGRRLSRCAPVFRTGVSGSDRPGRRSRRGDVGGRTGRRDRARVSGTDGSRGRGTGPATAGRSSPKPRRSRRHRRHRDPAAREATIYVRKPAGSCWPPVARVASPQKRVSRWPRPACASSSSAGHRRTNRPRLAQSIARPSTRCVLLVPTLNC